MLHRSCLSRKDVVVRRPDCGIQLPRNNVQILIEQIGMYIEIHACPCMAEHPLDGFDIGAGADSQTGGGVTESDLLLLRRIGWRRVDAAQDPREPVDAELEFVAGVIVGRGIERNVPWALRGGQG
jgi:hypothetical protein